MAAAIFNQIAGAATNIATRIRGGRDATSISSADDDGGGEDAPQRLELSRFCRYRHRDRFGRDLCSQRTALPRSQATRPSPRRQRQRHTRCFATTFGDRLCSWLPPVRTSLRIGTRLEQRNFEVYAT